MYPLWRRLPFARQFLLLGALAACSASTLLGYVLYFILRDFCIVCVSTYFVNAGVLFYAVKGLRSGSGSKKTISAKPKSKTKGQ